MWAARGQFRHEQRDGIGGSDSWGHDGHDQWSSLNPNPVHRSASSDQCGGYKLLLVLRLLVCCRKNVASARFRGGRWGRVSRQIREYLLVHQRHALDESTGELADRGPPDRQRLSRESVPAKSRSAHIIHTPLPPSPLFPHHHSWSAMGPALHRSNHKADRCRDFPPNASLDEWSKAAGGAVVERRVWVGAAERGFAAWDGAKGWVPR